VSTLIQGRKTPTGSKGQSRTRYEAE